MDLVIVESGAKAKTIQKYLGKNIIVKASNGHVQDLPTKGKMVVRRSGVTKKQIYQNRHGVGLKDQRTILIV